MFFLSIPQAWHLVGTWSEQLPSESNLIGMGQTELMRESLIYGTEYIQTKYECFQRLRESSFAEKTFAVFPTLVFGGNLGGKS